MSGSTDVLFVVYIRTNHLTKYSFIYFKEFTNMSKINHVKKVIEDLTVFIKYFRVIQEGGDGIQTIIYFIKDELQNSIKNNIYSKKRKEIILVEWGWTKNIFHYESYGKKDNKNEHNIKEYDISG